jgi:hypothetical protein
MALANGVARTRRVVLLRGRTGVPALLPALRRRLQAEVGRGPAGAPTDRKLRWRLATCHHQANFDGTNRGTHGLTRECTRCGRHGPGRRQAQGCSHGVQGWPRSGRHASAPLGYGRPQRRRRCQSWRTRPAPQPRNGNKKWKKERTSTVGPGGCSPTVVGEDQRLACAAGVCQSTAHASASASASGSQGAHGERRSGANMAMQCARTR